jgi:hypothetical protein
VIRRCENLDWLLVTKRPELFRPHFDTLRRLNTKYHSEENRAWFDREHGLPFEGVLIRWRSDDRPHVGLELEANEAHSRKLSRAKKGGK